MSFYSVYPSKTATFSSSVKRSSHKSLYSVANAQKKDQAPYPLLLTYGTTRMHLLLCATPPEANGDNKAKCYVLTFTKPLYQASCIVICMCNTAI